MAELRVLTRPQDGHAAARLSEELADHYFLSNYLKMRDEQTMPEVRARAPARAAPPCPPKPASPRPPSLVPCRALTVRVPVPFVFDR